MLITELYKNFINPHTFSRHQNQNKPDDVTDWRVK